MKTFGGRTPRSVPGGYGVALTPPSLLYRLRRLVLRRRRFLAALLFCAAAALAVEQLSPAPLSMATVVIAARDLPAGATLATTDLAAQKLPQSAVPAAAFSSISNAAGHQLAGPLRKGQVLTDASLVGTGMLVGAPPGSQAVPVRLDDPATVQLVTPGQLVTVVLSTGNGLEQSIVNEVLASAVPVLWKPMKATGPDLLPAKDTDGLLVVAADPAEAIKLAGASARGKVFLVLVNPP
jgi:Flp pilus assembly protein CpaB